MPVKCVVEALAPFCWVAYVSNATCLGAHVDPSESSCKPLGFAVIFARVLGLAFSRQKIQVNQVPMSFVGVLGEGCRRRSFMYGGV